MRTLCVLLPLLLAVADLGAASAVTLDGERIDGDALSLLAGGVVRIDQRELELADVDWIARREAEPAAWTGPSVLLADGSWIPATRIGPGGPDAIVADTVLGELALPLGTVIGWGPGEWLQAGTGADGDLVLVGAERYRGTVLGIDQDGLMLEVEELGEVALPLAKVVGLRLAEPVRPPTGLLLAATLDAGRPPAVLEPGGSGATLAALPTVAVAPLPPGRLQVLGGRRVWLSELDPVDVSERGAFGVTWPHGRDANLDGGPISLRGRRYERGLVVHSEAELSWQLEGAFVALVATVGIEDLVGAEGDCDVQLLVDGEERWARSGIRGGEAPEDIRLDLAGAQRLTLRVGFGRRYDIGDHLALAGAYLVRAE